MSSGDCAAADAARTASIAKIRYNFCPIACALQWFRMGLIRAVCRTDKVTASRPKGEGTDDTTIAQNKLRHSELQHTWLGFPDLTT
jgi:hypothetical protein